MANIKLVSGEIVTVINYKDVHDLIAEKLGYEVAGIVNKMNVETNVLLNAYEKSEKLAGKMEDFGFGFSGLVNQWLEYRTSKDPEIHQPQRIIKILDAFLTAEKADHVMDMMNESGEISDELNEISDELSEII